MESWEDTPPGSYSVKPHKKSAKEQAIAVGTPVGITGAIITVVELIKMFATK
jgi:hypothetical protein